MGETSHIEKRSGSSSSHKPRFGFYGHISAKRTWLIVLIGLTVIGIADYLCPPQTWFGPLYLMLIGFAAWSLGWQQSALVTLISLAISISVNGPTPYPTAGPSGLWNLGMRIMAVTAIISLLDNARRACQREWLLARTDPLTGALNRKAFFELVGEVEHSSDWNLLAYADLDGLKKLNDVYGHASGDKSLKAYADHVRSMIRKDDLMARIGGDEFLVYMSVPDENAAKSVSERLHKSMNAVVATNSAQKLRCSLGVLILAPGPRSIDRDLRLADELMYDAKERGAALNMATALVAGDELFLFEHKNSTHGVKRLVHDADRAEPIEKDKAA